MRTLSPKLIVKACHLAFNGKTYEQIAAEMGINRSSITNWKKTEIWKKTEARLVDSYIDILVETEKECVRSSGIGV